jgi:hypothetical protein
MARERHNNIVINVNSEAVQNKSWGINLQTLSSNITPLPKIICRFTTIQATNKMQQFMFIDPFKSALHISGANYAHPQEHFGCIYNF